MKRKTIALFIALALIIFVGLKERIPITIFLIGMLVLCGLLGWTLGAINEVER